MDLNVRGYHFTLLSEIVNLKIIAKLLKKAKETKRAAFLLKSYPFYYSTQTLLFGNGYKNQSH